MNWVLDLSECIPGPGRAGSLMKMHENVKNIDLIFKSLKNLNHWKVIFTKILFGAKYAKYGAQAMYIDTLYLVTLSTSR
jgi:hypothetical protein